MTLSGVLLVGCQPPVGGQVAPPPLGWHVQDGFLRDPDGRVVVLRGANASGQQKGPPYLDANQAQDYARLRTDWGMNVIRFVMTWAAIEPTAGHFDEAYLDAVATRLGWAQAAGLAVVLDMHQDIYGEGFGFDGAPRWACDSARYQAFERREPWFLNSLEPNVQACVDAFFTDANTRDHFTAAWQHVAQRFASAPAVIGFDVLNEPAWGTYPIGKFEQDRLQPFYEHVVAAVRKEAPGWVAFLEPAASRNLGIATGLSRFSFANVMYAPHSYDAGAESGSGFNPAHSAAIFDNVTALAEEARALDAGLWIGEYGGVTEQAGYAEYMQAEYAAAAAVSAGTSYWDFSRGGGYSMLTATGSDRPAALAALVRPYPQRIAGTPRGISYDPGTATFLFRYQPERLSTAVTEVFLPERSFPGGYQVSCTGCSYEIAGSHLRLTADADADEVTLRVQP
jgi:endoglycosylceramidase